MPVYVVLSPTRSYKLWGGPPTPLTPEQHRKTSFDTGIQLVEAAKSAQTGRIQTQAFLVCCRQALLIMEQVVGGWGYPMLRFDINRNISRIVSAAARDPEAHGGDLFQLVLDDVAEKGPSSVAAISLLWLKRSMEFFVGGLEELIQDPKITLQQAVVRAYPSTLKPFHGWLLVQVFRAAQHFVHSRERFLRSMGAVDGDPESEAAVLEQMGEYCRAFGALLAEVHQFLHDNGLNNLSKVSQRGP